MSSLLKLIPCSVAAMELLTLAERITYARERKGWQKIDLARAVGVSSASVTQWEQGQTKGLKPENLVAVARALEVSTDWLGAKKGPMERGVTLDMVSPREMAFLLNLRGLTDKQQDEAMRDVEAKKRQNEEIYEALAHTKRT
ncbi:MAG TPA: helix-turn-helix domain-containing protein [Candidatus Competibacteraceae bacterium]|nr:helix-turn-helix domain-containing protein [Candidatus Competibacteraceae bacterium]